MIADAGDCGVEPGALYERYRERVADPKSHRTMRTYLSKMAHYGLVDIAGTSRDRRYALDRSGYVDPAFI